MAFTTRITRHPGYVQVQVAGPTSIRDFVELVSTVGQETVFWSDRKVLVDLRQVEGELTPTEQIFLGELVAQDLSHIQRMASVVPPRQLTRNSEKAAQQLGSQLRVFDNEAEAIAWIKSDSVSAPVKPSSPPA
ncbi:MAG: hypothetical protein JWQ13_1429 [Ramlibacter sp.]|jgi:hypothetical protein|nr:hypothetical protein [Ramlibacter sp.]